MKMRMMTISKNKNMINQGHKAPDLFFLHMYIINSNHTNRDSNYEIGGIYYGKATRLLRGIIEYGKG